jgi:TonB family protein
VRIELPKGWSAIQLAPLELNETFAEYHESTEQKESVLIVKRDLLLKANSVTPDQLMSYRKFQKSIRERYATYTYLRESVDVTALAPAVTPAQGIARSAQLLRQSMMQLPGSSNAEALQAEQDARRSIQAVDYASAVTALKRAVSIDPAFSRAWIELGSMYYAGMRDLNSGLNAFQKAVEADPKQIIPYKILAFMYVGLGKRDDAIATWQKLQGIAPDDQDLAANLGSLYMMQKRYTEAGALFESETKSNPSNATAQLSLGIVRLRLHNTDQGVEAIHKALEIDAGAGMLNNAAYELAEADTHLPEALGYSQRSLNEIGDKLQKIDLANIRKEDLELAVAIGAYWDTLGWIYFKMGDLAQAESYLNSAWQLAQDGVIGDHLGQLYEKKHKLPEALHIYNLALEANPLMTDTQERMRMLSHVPLPEHRMSAGEELSWMRTVKLPKVIDESASADFDVLIMPSGKIEKAVFVHGSELLRNASTRIQEASFTQVLPKGSTTYLPRRGILSCGSAGCSFVFYRPSVAVSTFGQSISAEVHKDSSTSPGETTPLGGVFRVGGSITPPRVVYSPQPEYSEQARKAKLQGSCTIGLIVEQDGHTSHIRMLKGIGMGLDENAIAAVQKWKFEPAMKDGNPVRVEIAVEVSFHLYQNSGSPDAKQ